MLLTILLVLAALLGAFGWWGMYTRAGTARFDEMDGIIPFAAAVAAGLLLVAAGIVWWLRRG